MGACDVRPVGQCVCGYSMMTDMKLGQPHLAFTDNPTTYTIYDMTKFSKIPKP